MNEALWLVDWLPSVGKRYAPSYRILKRTVMRPSSSSESLMELVTIHATQRGTAIAWDNARHNNGASL